MLKWIKTRLKPEDDAPEHPLGSDANIEEWLRDIPTVDPQRVVLALDEWLDDPEHLAQQLTPAQFSRAVMRLDDFARPATLACWALLLKEFAQNQRTAALTRALETHFPRLHAAHWLAFQRLAGSHPPPDDKSEMALHAVRAMAAWSRSKTLLRMLYRDPGNPWWEMAYEMNRVTREQGLQHTLCTPYAGMEASSIWREFMVATLLETTPIATLTPNEIDASEGIVRLVEPRSIFADTPSTFTLFYIDLDQPAGPSRCTSGMSGGELRRYFGPGAGYQSLTQLRTMLVSEGKLPGWLEASGLSLEQAKTLLATLISHWSTTPPQRTQARHRLNGKLLVTHGLDIIRRMVAATEFAHSGRSLDYEGYVKSLTARHRDHAVVSDIPPPPRTPMDVLRLLETAGDRQMMEQWEITDISKQGLGARCTNRRPWHSIGALVGYRPEDEIDWHVGIIRRLGSSNGKPNVGLTTFGGTPQVSQVRPSNAKEDSLWSSQTQETSGLGWRDAIVVSSEDCLLLAPPGTFEVDRRIDISIGGRFRPARLAGLLGHAADYELIRYRESDAAPAAEE